MKLKMKFLALAALAFAGLAPSGAWASTDYYAQMDAIVATKSSGQGKVYANKSNSATPSYVAGTSSATNTQKDDKDFTFYGWAQANSGYTFMGWSDTDTGTINNTTASQRKVDFSSSYTSASDAASNSTKIYAHFGRKYYAQLTANAGTGGTAFASTSKSATSGNATATTESDVVETAPQLTLYAKATASSGYVFKGWSTTSGGSIFSAENPLTVTQTGGAPSPGATKIYWAVFEPQYYATVTVTARPSSGDWGLVYASNDDITSQPSDMAASKSTTWTTTTSGASHTFWLLATPKSGYMHWGWKLDSGTEEYNHGTRESYGGKDYFTRAAATTAGGTKAYNFEAIFKKLNTINKTLVLGGDSGANTITVPGTLQTWRTAVDTSKVTATQSGDNVVITAVATTPSGTATVEVLNGDDFNVYQIIVKRRYFAQLIVHSTGNGQVGVNNSTTAPSAWSATEKSKSLWVEHTSATPVTISGYGFAKPDDGYGLGGWSETESGAVTESGNPQLWTLDSSATSPGPAYHRYAHFGQAITVTHVAPTSGGTATITSSTPAASGNVITQFLPGTIDATFTATPSSSSYALRRWAVVEDGVTTYPGDNPLTRTFTTSATVQAEFLEYQSGGTQQINAGASYTFAASSFDSDAVVRSADPSLATGAIVGGKLVVTAGGKFGPSGDIGSTTVTVDSGTVLTTYTIKVYKPQHTIDYKTTKMAVDEVRHETTLIYPDPDEYASKFSTTVSGVAGAYQDGDYVMIKGVDRGTTTTTVDGYYFTAVYNIEVEKPYVPVAISKSIETCFLPVSASDPTDMQFADILDKAGAVSSSNPSMCTATQMGDKVQITTKSEGTAVITVDCHLATYQYTVSVSLYKPALKNRAIATAESFSDAFVEISAIEQSAASAALYRVDRDGNTITVTGLKVGAANFTVIGLIAGHDGYVSQEYSVQVYDGSQGHVPIGDGEVMFADAETTRYVELSPGVTNLVICYTTPGTTASPTGTFTIPEGFIARVDFLAIAGGGAGGTQAKVGNGAGGGGAGGVALATNMLLKAGEYRVVVGKGGKKADAKATAASGNNGENSYVLTTNNVGLAQALGGGGGAASMPGNTDGIYGGSGGGAAWYDGNCGKRGKCFEGQGGYGAASSTINNGGGGGGAGSDASEGTGGAGLTTDFTGAAFTYATGGAGGRGDVVKAGADGVNPGDGGEGGSGDFGGSGANGLVLVRIRSLIRYKIVPIPTAENGLLTERFEWEEGKTFAAFDAAAYNATYKNDHGTLPIDYIDGIVSTNCWIDKSSGQDVLKGNGYYTFVIYLKDGFAWGTSNNSNASNYGDTGGRQFNWRIVTPGTVQDATVAVNKWVDWDSEDATKATVHVTSHSSPEMSGGSCKVLFLGGLCKEHGQDKSTLVNALNAIARKGDVDYHLCYDTNETSHATWKGYHGTIHKGGTFNPDIIEHWEEDNHFVADQFAEIVSRVLDPSHPDYGGPYDYIVFEFDGNRTAYTSTINQSKREKFYPYIASAAEKLLPFYNAQKVIWIVDPVSKNPSDVFKGNYYQPSSWMSSGNCKSKLSFALFCALMDPEGIVDPTATGRTAYNIIDTKTVKVGYVSKYPENGDTSSASTYFALKRNGQQIYYDKSSDVESYLDDAIKVKPYNLKGSDMIKTNVGLDIEEVNVYFAPSTGAEKWEDVPDNKWENILRWTLNGGYSRPVSPSVKDVQTDLTVHTSSNYVAYTINNLLVEAWSKLDIRMVDDGTFKTSVGAVQNPNTGRWEKNPNYGSAKVAFIDEGGNETAVKGDAETSIPLTFNAYQLSGTVQNGEIFMNGMTNNPVSFAEGTSPSISYRGDAGYWLKRLVVDGHEQDIDATNMIYVLFKDINANHTVNAYYESVVGSVSVAKTTHVYDSKIHLPEVTLGDDWGIDTTDTNFVKIVYAASPGDTAEWMTAEQAAAYLNPPAEYTSVGTKTVYYRVLVNQPGWGPSGSFDEWGWKVAATGSGLVEITKATLYVKANDMVIRKGDDVPQNGGVKATGFVGSDTYESVLGSTVFIFTSPDYDKSTSGIGAYRLRPGISTVMPANYMLEYQNGVLAVEKAPIYLNGIAQAGFLKPEESGVERVEKTYDGDPTNLVAKVTSPEGGKASVTWRDDASETWQGNVPTYTDAGTYKVWFKVEGVGSDIGNYIASTNYQYVVIHPRPVTLLSGSDAKHFDGTVLTNNTVEVTEGNFVTGQGVDTECLARITEVGSLANVFTYTFKANTRVENYDITQAYGLLVVYPAQIVLNNVPQPDDPDPAKRLSPALDNHGNPENGVQPIVKTYDGKGTNLVIQVNRPNTGTRIRYTTTPDDPNSWREDFALTDVFDGSIWYAVEDESGNFAPVTNYQFVTISPRPVDVYAGSAERQYDGTALTCTAVDHVDNMVEGESIAEIVPTIDSYIVHAGTTANHIADVVPAQNTDRRNYSFTYFPGTLTVTKRPVTITSPTKSGKFQPGMTFTFYTSEITGDNFVGSEVFTYSNLAALTAVGSCKATFDYADGTALVNDYDVTVVEGDLILGEDTIYVNGVEQTPEISYDDPAESGVECVIAVYDGTTFLPKVTVSYPTVPSTVSYALSAEGPFLPASSMTLKSVSAKQKVWFKVEADGYTPVTGWSYVTITPRPLTITADSKEKTYDGTPLTCDEATSDGFIAGEGLDGVAMTAASTRTEAGSTPNVIDTVSYTEATDPSNYTVTLLPGLLTVTPATAHPDVPEISRMYDGTATNFVITVPKEEIANPNVLYSTDGGKTYTTTPPSYTDVTNTPVIYVIEDPSGNYAAITNTATVVITPRLITVSVNPAQMKLGQPEPAYSAIVTCDDNGEVLDPAEQAKIVYNIGPTGIKVVGENTLHASGEKLQGNYSITYVDNILTIYDKNTLEYTLDGVTVTYDGYGHGLTAQIGSGMPTTRVRYAYAESGPWYVTYEPATNASQDAGMPIWYALTPEDDTYQAVTNVAVVKVLPRETILTADNAEKWMWDEDPASFTATASNLAVPDAGKTGLFAYTCSRAPGEAVGTYDITVTCDKEYQGNYRVTDTANGTFTIVGVTSSWICDHADAGNGKVHLAFCPVLNASNLTAARVLSLSGGSHILAASAATEDDLAKVTPAVVPLRDPTGKLDVTKGWIWVTVDVPLESLGQPLLWKVVVETP